MPEQQLKENWEAYRTAELAKAAAVSATLGFALDETQVHIGGERFLMSGKKLVLTGRRTSDGKRVIIKFSSDAKGIEEMQHERRARQALLHLDFAYRAFFLPDEVLFLKRDGYAFAVTLFIAEERAFLKHSVQEQFFLALRAFETQESLHVTTHSHAKAVHGIFGSADAASYLRDFGAYKTRSIAAVPEEKEMIADLERASSFLDAHRAMIDAYGDFLTHTDFVPHNLRIVGRDIYLLDTSSIRFGNKYESWARFLNFMVIHDTELERLLMRYVKENRGEEYLCLRLMRVFKLGFLIDFYTSALSKTSGDLHALSVERVGFWVKVLRSVLDDVPVTEAVIAEYRANRDRLRSEEEKQRQRELQQLPT